MSKVPLISPLLTPPGIIYFKHALGGGGGEGFREDGGISSP